MSNVCMHMVSKNYQRCGSIKVINKNWTYISSRQVHVNIIYTHVSFAFLVIRDKVLFLTSNHSVFFLSSDFLFIYLYFLFYSIFQHMGCFTNLFFIICKFEQKYYCTLIDVVITFTLYRYICILLFIFSAQNYVHIFFIYLFNKYNLKRNYHKIASFNFKTHARTKISNLY